MKKYNKKTAFLICVFLLTAIQMPFAQNENFLSRSSIGVMLGGSYYIGDLNRFGHFNRTQLAGGLMYRYHINSRFEWRAGVRYGKVAGKDIDSKDPFQQSRNLSFESNIFEFSSGAEFNYLDYKLGNKKYNLTAYLFAELGVFRMNPKTEYNGEMIELQTIGTEGQGSNLTEINRYSLTQIAIPFGVGFKFNIGKRSALSVEYGIRKTFTDYLDDVGKGDFIDKDMLSGENGDIAANLSGRGNTNFKLIGKRGNPKTKDWYSMFGLIWTFSLGNPDNCFFQYKL